MSLVASRDLVTYLATAGRLVDDALERYLPPESSPPAIIHQAMRYSVFAGGKRLRPILVMASAEACGAAAGDAIPVACAVELIHTYSLIHDDLPAMDDSQMRRGRPTCHVAFGDAIAVLAGDALHALAFELITRAERPFGPERALLVSREIAASIGTAGMVGGQVLDLLGEGRAFPGLAPAPQPPPQEAVGEIHIRKTAALIRACVRAGGILAGAPPADVDALTQYGDRVGLAFQIVDDILDVVSEEGKKATYPAAFGLQRSREIASELTAQALEAVREMGPRADLLSDLATYLLTREA